MLLQVALLCAIASIKTACAEETEAPPPTVPDQQDTPQPTRTAQLHISQSQPATTDEATEVVSLTNQLLLKEIDLERFYLRYRMHGTKEPKFRKYRFFALQQTAASTFLASNIINMVETAEHFKTPNTTNGHVLTNSCTVGEVASIIGGSSSALELGSNALIAVKNKIQKKDPKTARLTVVDVLREIDDLTRRRNAAVERYRSHPAYEIFVAEGKVLKSFRDWCVYEFCDVYADVKSYEASCNVFYVLDISAYTTSWVAYQLAAKAFKSPRFARPALYNGFMSDSFFTIEAPSYTASGKWFYNRYYKKVAKELNEQPFDAEDDAKGQMYKLEALAATTDDSTLALVGPIATRLSIYSFWSTRYDKYIDKRMAEMRRLSRIALQSTVAGPLLGTTGLTQDVCNAIGLYGWKNNPFMQNALAFAGATTTTCGSLASMGLTGWWFIDDLRHEQQAKHRKILPMELLDQRLRTLETLEEMIGRKTQ